MDDVPLDEDLTIGQFAALTGLSVKALRLYDDSGLLVAARVDPWSGYRYYRPAQRDRAVLIAAMRRAGVPLGVVGDVVDSDQDGALAVLHRWWDAEQRASTTRRGVVAYVAARLVSQGAPPMQVHTRHVPDRTLAVVSRDVVQSELQRHVVSSFTTLFGHLVAAGVRSRHVTPDEPTYVIYHGTVTSDVPTRVDVCVPFTGVAEPTPDVQLHREAAHVEAYVELTKAEMAPPAILHAFDTVEEWVHRHGRRTGPPRAVYVADWEPTGRDEHVADIAFPLVLSEEG